MSLADQVTISGRFLRSTRIDMDGGAQSLEGYVFPESLKAHLLDMGAQQQGTGQGAYTWTGPYGSGKSSLALLMSQLLNGNETSRKRTAEFIDDDAFVSKFHNLLPPMKNGWRMLNMVGELASPHKVVARHLNDAGFATVKPDASEADVVSALSKLAQKSPKTNGGLILIVDEMGKFLEDAAINTSDIYFFQLLAEEASRSNGRLIVIGILHQAFQEYASKLGKEIRDEWAKIQGRFADIPVNISGEEQIELISRAIVVKKTPRAAMTLATQAGSLVRQFKPSFGIAADKALAGAWPLNPISALMLGPLSRRSYGQNQRSLFTFLSSSEAFGFQDFLSSAKKQSDQYTPAHLWDYLRHNLQSSIAVSGDSHHFSNALEAMERCTVLDGGPIEVDVIKCIALLELTRQQTGVGASFEALALCLPTASGKDLKAALKSLQDKSLVVFKQFRGAYGIFEGSDFDIEAAIQKASREVSLVDLAAITETLAVSMISAKRHYHETGTMRWCDFAIVPADQLASTAQAYGDSSQAFGLVTLILPTNGESSEDIAAQIKKCQKASSAHDLLAATAPSAKQLVSLANDHAILRYLLENERAIDRDKVARREIKDRLEAITKRIEQEIWRALNDATWFVKGKKGQQVSWSDVNGIVSDLADARFPDAPRIFNELINRTKPSGSANGALKLLMHAMVLRGGKEQLGFEKFPAEKGLFCSIMEANELYVQDQDVWRFVGPDEGDKANLHPLWQATRHYLEERHDRNVSLPEIYDLWQQAPFGVRDGVMPLLAVLFLITERSSLAFYREGIFLSSFTDIDVDYLSKAPETINFRWMNMSELSRQLLANMADVAANLTDTPVLNLEPLDVARALIAAFEGTAPWVHKTARLSQNAMQIRTLFKRSNDPNRFLFDDIPALYADKTDITTADGIEFVTDHIRDGLKEILDRYPEMLRKLGDQVLAELQVPSASPQAIAELNARATNIKGITGDMRLEAFIGRLTHFKNTNDDIEKLAGLGINKPARTWVDSDLDRAAIELINFAQAFNKSETVARVKGRKDKRDSMAVVVGMDGRPVPLIHEFDVMESEKDEVAKLAKDLTSVLERNPGTNQNIALAALATVSAHVIGDQGEEGDEEDQGHA